jgi:ribosomal protein S18 acetylase RimI-like enzyme
VAATAGVEVTPLERVDVPAAVEVAARGMRDNPIHVAAFGPDPDRREQILRGLFRSMFRHLDQQALCAKRDGEVVGVCGRLPPGACRPTALEGLRMAPALLTLGPRKLARTVQWVGAWRRRDPDERHEHLGPVAVDRHLQGLGIGSAMMAVHAEALDVRRLTGWLETDKEANVRFYKRFGYEVAEQADVLGVPNWFMRRASR